MVTQDLSKSVPAEYESFPGVRDLAHLGVYLHKHGYTVEWAGTHFWMDGYDVKRHHVVHLIMNGDSIKGIIESGHQSYMTPKSNDAGLSSLLTEYEPAPEQHQAVKIRGGISTQ